MNTPHIAALICPVCQEPLAPQDQMVGCTNGHPFNVARQGHVNLLLSHQRKSKNPGDDDAMIQARRRFFDAGAFDQLTQQLCANPLFSAPNPAVLDCGCGEGHMLGALSQQQGGSFYGLDISKKAVQLAAGRNKQATWVVGNGMRDIPIASSSMDVILSILAPRNPAEFDRILKPAGALLLGVPGPNHLIELRKRLQFTAGDFSEKADVAAEKCAPLFQETDRQLVHYQQTLSPEQIADLTRMTPIFWHSSAEAKEQVMTLNELTVTISFCLITLRKLA